MVQFTALLLPVALFASATNAQFFGGGGESPYSRLKLGGSLGQLIGGGGASQQSNGFGQVLSSLLSQGQGSSAQSQSPLQQLATAASNTYIAAIRSAMPGFANLMGSASAQPQQYALPPMGMHAQHGQHGGHHNHPHPHPPGPMAFPGGFGGPGMSFMNTDNSFFPGHTANFDSSPFAGAAPMNFNPENFNFGPSFGNMNGMGASHHAPSPHGAHHFGGGGVHQAIGPHGNHGPSASLYGGQYGGRDRDNQYNSASNVNSASNNGPRDNNFDRK